VTAARAAQAGPIARARLHRQGIATPRFDAPEDVVGWMLAMQAQDYLGALWAIGLRMREATEARVERAVAERRIVRSWPMRGTLHFVAAEDVRWLLALLAPRSIARDRLRLPRQHGLDDAAIAHARRVTEALLEKEGALAREALYARWEAAGIGTAQQRGINLVNRLAQEGVLCHGARDGSRQTYVLLDDWVPATRPVPRDEALARLALRYLRSRGPATAQDLAWWSGLTVKDAQAAIASVAGELHAEAVDGNTYWRVRDDGGGAHPRSLHLLPPFDEFLVAYADRGAARRSTATSSASTACSVPASWSTGAWSAAGRGGWPAARCAWRRTCWRRRRAASRANCAASWRATPPSSTGPCCRVEPQRAGANRAPCSCGRPSTRSVHAR
jgi:hypothetical protein